MRKLTTISLLLTAAYCFAQPVLDATNTTLIPGPTYSITVSAYVDPGPSGADVTWDLSGLQPGPVATAVLVDPANDPILVELFPNATLITTNSLSGQAKGYEVTDTYIDNWGVFSNSNQLHLLCTNAVRELVLPCTFGTTWSDTDLADYFLNGFSVGIRTGSTVGTADAYGELILPNQTFTNVLRVHLEQSVSDNTNFGSAVTTGHRYQYYLPGFPAPLAEVIDFVTVSNGNTTIEQRVQWMADDVTGLDQLNESAESVLAFPNPATGRVTLLFNGLGAVRVHVIDASGREVLSKNLSYGETNAGRCDMSTGALDAGAYIVRLIGSEGEWRAIRLVVD